MDEDGCFLGCAAYLWLLGMIVAVVLSWQANASILWATVHGALGWVYVAYYAFVLGRFG